jgi:hypothetical protein
LKSISSKILYENMDTSLKLINEIKMLNLNVDTPNNEDEIKLIPALSIIDFK